MGELKKILNKKAEILAIASRYGIENIRVFGSVMRGDDNSRSDIDLLVDVKDGSSLFDLGGAVVEIQDLLGRKVDIVTENGLHWYLREKILKEAKYL